MRQSLNRLCLALAGAALGLGGLLQPAGGQVLFDNTKAETAGNADWVIDSHQPVPSPTLTNITAATAETYWTGALSSWGVALAKLRNAGQISLGRDGLETLPATGAITYGNGSNPQDLSHYQVYVVCEPNIRFTDAEKTAILNFVKDGGGLFMVADHLGSDRNNDGWDSLGIWNDLMTNNSVQVNPFGFSFNAVDVTPSSVSVDSSPADPLVNGLAGTVTTLTYSSGTTMSINNATTTHAAVWSGSSSTGVMALYGTFGAGRFAAIGDSSVVEDATSEPGHTTYAGWTTPGDNGYCALNGTVWLLGGGGATTNPLPPTVTTGAATAVTTTAATLNGTVNPNAQSTTAQFEYGLSAGYGQSLPLSGTLTGTAAQAVSVTLSGLTAGTTYHFRLDATNAAGTTLGQDQTFTTPTGTTGGSGGATNVVISQFYGAGGNSSGVSYKNDFVELFNPLPTAVNVSTWSVQYASASGSTWQVGSLSGSIQPYHYYLVQLASGGANGATLPSADATAGINISATSGKLALVSNQTALSGASPEATAGVVDFVGFGSASAYQGNGAAPSGGNTTSTLRKNGGFTDTFDNGADFTTLTPPNPRNVYSAPNPPLTPIEQWRLQWFGTTTNTGLAADGYVGSSDGMANLVKYALGLNPLVATTNPVVGDITSGYLRLTSPKNPSATDVSFSVEVTGSLSAPSWATNGTTVLSNTASLLQVRDNTAVPGTTNRYMRLRVSEP